MYRWAHFSLNKARRYFHRMAGPQSMENLKDLLRVLQEVTPPQRSLIDYSYVPNFLHRPSVEMTKELLCGVDCDEVYPHIFVGDQGSAKRKSFLKAVGITHVLNTAEGKSFGQVNTNADYYADSGIKYLGFNFMDNPQTKLLDSFERGVNFIHEGVTSGGCVLVHCLMGISRSASFVCAYLMLKENMTAKQALITIRKQREVRPNDGFLVQLLQLEAKGLEKK